MKRIAVLAIGLQSLMFNACTVFHVEMLSKSIEAFSGKAKLTPGDKVWVTSMADSACNSGCQLDKLCGGGKEKMPKMSMFGGSDDGSSPYDKLAFEVIANYLTQNNKAAVIESHRHNFAMGLAGDVAIRQKIDVKAEDKSTSSMMSCADLCLLDEAKEKKADKVLAYHIMAISAKELTIHFRLSNVKTGIVENAGTVRVVHPQVYDASFIDNPEVKGK